MADIRRVNDRFAVAPQLAPGEIAAAAQAGFKTVICNRPDEEAPGFFPSSAAEDEARKAGITFVYAPFQGQPSAAAIDALTQALGSAKGPVLAYCRSGTRSVTAWAIAAARNRWAGADEIIERASDAGYALENMRVFLKSLT